MSDITGISNLYTSTDYTSTSSIQNSLTNTDYSSSTEDELMDACKEFEEYFIEQAFEGMEKMIPETDEDSDSSSGTSYVDMFKDTLYQEYASSVTERGDGIGIATMLYEQMKRNYDL